MSVLKRVGRQASFYALAEILSSLTGLVSMPIFTRIFTQAQYGILNLVDSSFKLAGTLSGMGLRPAVVRLWGEFKDGKRPGGTAALASTMMSASTLVGLLVTLLFTAAIFLPEHVLEQEARELVAMSAAVILFRNIIQMVLSIVQSQEKAGLRSSILLAERYSVFGMTLLFAAFFRLGLRGFFTGLMIAEGGVCLFCTWYALRHLHWRPRWWDNAVVRESMLYGLPLLGLNVSGFVTEWADRFLLNYFRDAAELGIYAAGYNMSNYVTEFFVPALNSALIPVTMNVWSEKGPEEAQRSLEKFLGYYALVALPLLFGVSAVAEEGIRLLASEKFVASAQVVPWVLGAKLIQGAYFPFMAGLFLTKRTGYLALFLAGAGVLNLVLNWFMIPSMGMMGAAITTLIAYAVYVFGGGLFSQRYLRLRFPVRSFLAYGVAAAGMYLLIMLLPDFESDLLALALKVPLGMLSFVVLAWLLDAEVRNLLRQGLARFRR